ncbi:MAG TPA: hypothetical protein VM328_05745, partial [Fimbriimonadaceae bacterium]|nr:hypothetical protein [Fimbriimonadaceae bacterium]
MTLLSLVATVSVLVAPQDALARPVTFTSVAKPAKRMLAELGQTAQVQLLTTGVTENEVLVIDVREVPLVEVMTKIADVTNAEWKQEGPAYRLVRPEMLARKERQQEFEHRLAQAKVIQSKLLEEIRKAEPWDPSAVAREAAQHLRQSMPDVGEGDWRRVQAVGQKLPLGRAITRVVAGLDPAILAAMEPGSRLVFSSVPNRMQRPMPPSAEAAIRDMLRMQRDYSAALARLVGDAPAPTVIYSDSALHLSMPFENISKILLVLTANRGEGYRAELALIDRESRSVGRSGRFLHSYYDMSGFVQPTQPPKLDPNEPAIEWSPLAGAQIAAVRSRSREGRITLPPELQAFYSQPERNDPLSLVASEALIALARSHKRNLVACLPDTVFSLSYGLANFDKLTPSRVAWNLEQSRSLAQSLSDKWLTLESIQPVQDRRHRSNRPALGVYLRAILAKGRADLDLKARYSLSFEGESWQDVGSMLANLMAPARGGGDFEGGVDILRIYGLFNPSQRARMFTGEPVPIGMLTPQQLSHLERMVYQGESGGLSVSQSAGGIPIDWRQEPTELLPNGIP